MFGRSLQEPKCFVETREEAERVQREFEKTTGICEVRATRKIDRLGRKQRLHVLTKFREDARRDLFEEVLRRKPREIAEIERKEEVRGIAFRLRNQGIYRAFQRDIWFFTNTFLHSIIQYDNETVTMGSRPEVIMPLSRYLQSLE